MTKQPVFILGMFVAITTAAQANGPVLRGPVGGYSGTIPAGLPSNTPPVTETVGEAPLPIEVRPHDMQLQRLHRQVSDLEQRLAALEKAYMEHRHTLTVEHPNAMNYKTVRYLLDNADTSDGLLYFPKAGSYRMETTPALTPEESARQRGPIVR